MFNIDSIFLNTFRLLHITKAVNAWLIGWEYLAAFVRFFAQKVTSVANPD
jgi:hypothetical protein